MASPLLLTLALCAAWASGTPSSNLQEEKEILKEIFSLNKFHMLTRPPPPSNSTTQNEPLQVTVDYWIMDVPDISDAKNEYQVQMYLREEWMDERLAYTTKGNLEYVSINDATGFWMPDLFFANEKSSRFHTVTKPNNYMRIYPNGKVFYSQRISLTIGCIMNLRLYPFDSQTCPIRIESYGYKANEVSLRWKTEEGKQVQQVSSGVGYSVFQDNQYCHATVGENVYSCLKLSVSLHRHRFFFLVKFYLPLLLLVLTSWVTFWLSAKAVLARMTISITTAACTVLHLCVYKRYFLPVSYLTALDVWIGASALCIFAALFENALVCSKQKANEDAAFKVEDGLTGSSEKLTNDASGNQFTAMKYLMARLTGRPLKADKVARVLLPLLFIIFNIVYAFLVTCVTL